MIARRGVTIGNAFIVSYYEGDTTQNRRPYTCTRIYETQTNAFTNTYILS